ncbi:MAG: carbonic anhydrase family protein [Flavobacteriaceae bacterium]|nr:carbonic anhydrase family protein [Flavobacteriaceae bacterium]
MKKTLNVIAIVTVLMLFGSCKNETKKAETPKPEVEESLKVSKKDCNEVHWSHHKGEKGPENWKDLCDGFADCGGKSQSPINIVTSNISKESKLVAPKFNYAKSAINIVNNGHTVQFNITGENTVDLNGKDYKLLQFHYHAKSEHTINGKYYPIEVHFVHQHSATEYAVLGMMFEEGKPNKLFSKYLDKFPTSKGEFKSEDMVDVLSLFPSDKNYYNYQGSLTTPPCSEVVNWHVLKTPLTASKEQIAQFSKILNSNYRPIMPLNGRTVGQSN